MEKFLVCMLLISIFLRPTLMKSEQEEALVGLILSCTARVFVYFRYDIEIGIIKVFQNIL